MSCTTYTIPEFFQMTRRKELTRLDKMIGHIKKNEKLYMQLIVTVAVFSICSRTVYASPLDTINGLGRKGLSIARAISYWLILIKGLSDIAGAAMQGDRKGAIEKMITYIIIYGLLFLFPLLMDMVKEAF